MKIYCEGSRFFGGQIERIESGFVQFGHELTTRISEADLLYCNNPWFEQLIKDKTEGRLKGKLIFNVLDIPEHIIGQFDTVKLQLQLMAADKVTSISQWTRGRVENHCAVQSSVIWNPIKPIIRKPRNSGLWPFISVGRRSDFNKRSQIWTSALQMLGIDHKDVALIGNEPWIWGEYLGVQSDLALNELYNGADFVLATGKIEGLNLPVIEGMAAGIIPVICNDLTTREELLPASIFPEYNNVTPDSMGVAAFVARFLKDQAAMEDMKNRLHQHYLDNWQEKTSPKGVARRILNEYDIL